MRRCSAVVLPVLDIYQVVSKKPGTRIRNMLFGNASPYSTITMTVGVSVIFKGIPLFSAAEI